MEIGLILVLILLLLTCCSGLKVHNIMGLKRNNQRMRVYANPNEACKSLVVWDCDGVLVDSEALLKQGEVEALEALGHNLTVDDCVRLFSGVSPDKAAVRIV